MKVSLRKRYARQVATVGDGPKLHAIRGSFSYMRTNFTVCGRKATGLGFLRSGRPTGITCKGCL